MVLVRTEMETSSMNFPAVAVARCSKLRHTEIVRQPGSNAEFCSVPTEPKGAHSILGNLKTPTKFRTQGEHSLSMNFRNVGMQRPVQCPWKHNMSEHSALP